MMRLFRRHLRPGIAGAVAVALHAAPGSAQTTSMPATLRYGSGLLDIPVGSVLPHLVVTGTYSGFGISVPQLLVVDRRGEVVARGEPFDKWLSDGSVAIGLFGRVELGATVQHIGSADEGGRMLGGFGRLSVLPAAVRFLDVALGMRYVSAPTYGDGYDYDFQPNRFGYPDARIFNGSGGSGEFSSTVSPYVVATARLPGFEAGADYGVTLSAGWGGGMFSAGRDLDFYGTSSSGGLFAGSTIHLSIGEGRLLNLMAEYNGFDANAGLQVDFGGLRIGAFSLGLGGDGHSTFRTRKFGILGSVTFCAGEGGLCSPGSDEAAPDTIVLPAPPPDTVVIERTPAPQHPPGTPATLCLATGVEVDVVLTAAGDTLVGPSRVAISDLRPGVGFAGAYAGGQEWFARGGPVTLGERSYDPSGAAVRLACRDIVRVGTHEGIPVFAELSVAQRYRVVYVPVAPGLWQGYRLSPPPSAVGSGDSTPKAAQVRTIAGPLGPGRSGRAEAFRYFGREIAGRVDVRLYLQIGYAGPRFVGASHGVTEHSLRAPQHPGEQGRPASAEAHQVVSAIGRGPEHYVGRIQRFQSQVDRARVH